MNIEKLTEEFEVAIRHYKVQEGGVLSIWDQKPYQRNLSKIILRQKRKLDQLKNEVLKMPKKSGEGVHTFLTHISMRAFELGVKKQQAYDIINEQLSNVLNRNNNDLLPALDYAYTGHCQEKIELKPEKLFDPMEFDRYLIGQQVDFKDLKALSPIEVPEDNNEAVRKWIKELYRPSDIFCCGNHKCTFKEHLKTARELIQQSKTPEFITINDLTGEYCLIDKNLKSFRYNKHVKSFRYCLIEFDGRSIEQQLQFWYGYIKSGDLPEVCSIVFSGNKSLHVLLKLEKVTKEDWNQQVVADLYHGKFIPFGCDPSCHSPSQLTRCPGGLNRKNNKRQELLYLNGGERK